MRGTSTHLPVQHMSHYQKVTQAQHPVFCHSVVSQQHSLYKFRAACSALTGHRKLGSVFRGLELINMRS